MPLFKFSYWSKFDVNIINGSGVMTIFFYKGLTGNPEIGNTPVWVLANIWSWRQGKDTKYGTNVSNKMLLNATKCQGYSFYRFCVIKGKPTREVGGKLPLPPPLTQITLYSCCSILFYFPTSKVSRENLSVLNRFFETYALTVQFCGSQFSITLW